MKLQKKLMITMSLGEIRADFIKEKHLPQAGGVEVSEAVVFLGRLELSPELIDNYMRPLQVESFLKTIIAPVLDDFSRFLEAETEAAEESKTEKNESDPPSTRARRLPDGRLAYEPGGPGEEKG